MRSTSLSYLIGLIIFWLAGVIPFFWNLSGEAVANLRGIKTTITKLYLYTTFMGMIQGAFLVLFLKSLLINLKKTKLEKFDLGGYGE